MYESHDQPLASRQYFLRRFLLHLLGAICLVVSALIIGVLGYHYCAQFSWIDSLLNASMILAGMGPVDILPNDGAKIFASFYAIFSGVVFLGAVGVLFAPLFHRFLHRFHLELDDD